MNGMIYLVVIHCFVYGSNLEYYMNLFMLIRKNRSYFISIPNQDLMRIELLFLKKNYTVHNIHMSSWSSRASLEKYR